MQRGLDVAPQQAPDTKPAPQQEAPQDQMAGEPASPEEQEIYEKVVSMAMLAMYDESVVNQVVEAAKADEDPSQALAAIAAALAIEILTQARDEGVTIPGDVMLHAGREIVALLIELAQKKAGVEMSPEQAERTYYLAMDEGTQLAQAEGFYDEAAAAQDMERLGQMTQDGTVDRLLGGR